MKFLIHTLLNLGLITFATCWAVTLYAVYVDALCLY